MDRTGLRDGDVVAIRATPEAKNGDGVVAQFGGEVALKRFVRLNTRRVELRPENDNPEHEPGAIDLAKHIGVIARFVRRITLRAALGVER